MGLNGSNGKHIRAVKATVQVTRYVRSSVHSRLSFDSVEEPALTFQISSKLYFRSRLCFRCLQIRAFEPFGTFKRAQLRATAVRVRFLRTSALFGTFERAQLRATAVWVRFLRRITDPPSINQK